MRAADPFFDTGILLYLLSSDAERADRVEALLAESGTISVQVLNELAAVASGKFKMPRHEIRDVLETVRDICLTESLTVEDHDRACGIMGDYALSFYDSLIVASALHAGCTVLYSEDLQHGQVIDKQLKVTNPFEAE